MSLSGYYNGCTADAIKIKSLRLIRDNPKMSIDSNNVFNQPRYACSICTKTRFHEMNQRGKGVGIKIAEPPGQKTKRPP